MTKVTQALLIATLATGLGTATYAAEAVQLPDLMAPVIATPPEMTAIDYVPVVPASPVPEPSHMAMYGLAAMGLLYRRFRRPKSETVT